MVRIVIGWSRLGSAPEVLSVSVPIGLMHCCSRRPGIREHDPVSGLISSSRTRFLPSGGRCALSFAAWLRVSETDPR
jgi:hypothetical protein